MNKYIKGLIALIGLTVISLGAQAAIGPTQVQYSSAGNGAYDINGIDTLDFDDTASVVWSDALVAASNGETTLSGFFANAAPGATMTFDFNYQSTLVNFNQTGPAGTVPVGFEVTAVTSGQLTASLVAPGFLIFTNITGSYEVYHDSNAATASNNAAGTGFTDGTQILGGSLGLSSGSFNTVAGQGSIFFNNNINFVNNAFIAADPLSNAPLIGTTIDTTLNFSFGTSDPINVGATTGISGYTVQGQDMILAGDASLGFVGTNNTTKVPEPSAIFLLGGGLMMMGGFLKKRKA